MERGRGDIDKRIWKRKEDRRCAAHSPEKTRVFVFFYEMSELV
jgi:hypothetical protein